VSGGTTIAASKVDELADCMLTRAAPPAA